eukprot:TRINITY_DN67010_c7_g10_i1.p1 TRINITY_DN67010_c7_g10~~TRINITY_DN67010_c7_g10_i1.p1  ORF type:complete len:190 (+),score=6.94 TRINITY_DN67010_c7_g10_i1:24-593(+)
MRLLCLFLLFAPVLSYQIPCVFNETHNPAGCSQRIVPCSQVHRPPNAILLAAGKGSNCENNWPKLRDTILTPEAPNNTYVVEFTDQYGSCWGITMQGGECWGTQPITKHSYGCQGRCGPGCEFSSGKCSNWGRDCLRHDACSWFFGASGGLKDKNCGDEFKLAINDFLHCCEPICKRVCAGVNDTCGLF